LEKSSSTAPARVPVASNGGAEPGDHAKAAVRGISRNRTIVGSLSAARLVLSKHEANKRKLRWDWRKGVMYGIIIDQRYKGASTCPSSHLASRLNLGQIAAWSWHQRPTLLSFAYHQNYLAACLYDLNNLKSCLTHQDRKLPCSSEV